MAPKAPLLHLVLTPHRSLGPRGFAVLMSVTAVLAAFIAVRFLLLSAKAWPVAVFMVLDVVLLYIAFQVNYRSATEREDVWLDAKLLEVRHRGRDGIEHVTQLNPHWVQVELQVLNEFQNRLHLISHGKALAIGSFLAPHERVEIGDEIQAVLGRLKSMSRSA
jgi:uncharacterized membrane protein